MIKARQAGGSCGILGGWGCPGRSWGKDSPLQQGSVPALAMPHPRGGTVAAGSGPSPAARAGSPRPPKGIQIPPPSPAGHVQAAFAQGMGQLLAMKEFAIAKSEKKPNQKKKPKT